MLAAVLHGVNDVRLEDVPVPEPGPGEVVVRVRACGFCATDYKVIAGIRRNVSFPCIVGHEPSGVISAVGAHVRHVRVGDEVAVMVNGAGATPPMELYILNRRVQQILADKGVKVFKTFVGDYMTSIDMAGASITLLKLDAELKDLLLAQADTIGFKMY